MSSWSEVYLVAGLRLEITSEAGDPAPFFPRSMPDFATGEPGDADLTISLLAGEAAQASPLKHFFPPQFIVESCPEGLSFASRRGEGERLGLIMAGSTHAQLVLPPLDGPWSVREEEESVRESIQAFVRGCLQWRLLEEGDTLMHAAGILWEGGGFAFTGHTRAGKTTLCRDFPAQAVLGDDLVAARGLRGSPALFGTPWSGREGGAVAYGGFPLRAVFNLHQGAETVLHAQTPAEALAELATNAPRLRYAGEESKLLAVFSSLVETVPIYRLSLKLGDDVLPYMRQAAKDGG